MKKNLAIVIVLTLSILSINAQGQTKKKPVPKYDTIIRLHVEKPVKKPVAKPVAKPIAKPPEVVEIILPVPEFINQPYYYDQAANKIVQLESSIAHMITKKKTFGLKGAKQMLTMDGVSSKIRFTEKKDICFIVKTGGDVIDLTSYIRLYQFIPAQEKREVTINSKEGMLNDKEEQKGKLIAFSVKMLSKDNYMIQFADQLTAGEYGFVWVKNMELKEFAIFNFGINWKSSD